MTMSAYWLDRAGDGAREDLRSVRTETEFLRHALSGEPLLVHGARLCDWAERFGAGRGIAVHHWLSPGAELQGTLGLTPEQAGQVLRRWPALGQDALLRADHSLLAAHLAGGRAAGTAEHAAEWLLVRLDAEADPTQQELLTALGEALARDSLPAWHPVYRAYTDALPGLLLDWLGLGKPTDMGTFPLELRGAGLARVQAHLEAEADAGGTQAFGRWRERGVPTPVLRSGAALIADRLLAQPTAITEGAVSLLERYLPPTKVQRLRDALPVRPPSPLPARVEDWKRWLEHDYLPYRRSPRADQEALLPHLRDFAERFLEMYRRALNAGPHGERLVWQRVAALKGGDAVTLVLICDGLGFNDLEHLQRHLNEHDSGRRLTLEQSELTFAPLPTLTSQAKPTLERGIARVLSDSATPLGSMATQEGKVQADLRAAQPGDVVFWNHLEPDRTYHKAETLGQARTMAGAALMGLAERTLGLLLGLPSDTPVRLVLTTDHGRLLLESERSVTPPPGFRPEGRAALGTWAQPTKQGFELQGDFALLAGASFGMTGDAAVMWGNHTFRTVNGAGGHTVGPHGGITPEEVLIPWVSYRRDLTLKPLLLTVSGRGVAEQPGAVRVRVQNPNPVPLTAGSAHGTLADRMTAENALEWQLPPHGTVEHEVHLSRWPTSAELAGLTFGLNVRNGPGHLDPVYAQPALAVEELYTPAALSLDDF